MADTFWLKQIADRPLYPDMLWSRPENKQTRGKLLIIGGNSHSFSDVSLAYGEAQKAGIGTVRAILPNSLQKSLGKLFPEAEFAPSTPSGSFARTALSELLDISAWANGVLLAGDFGKNSETAVLLESFVDKYRGSLTLSGDSLGYFINSAEQLLKRPGTILVGDFSQIQKLAAGSDSPVILKHDMNLNNLVERLHDWTQTIEASVLLPHAGQAIVATSGQVSTTAIKNGRALAAFAAVWQLQQPARPFEALASAVYEYSRC